MKGKHALVTGAAKRVGRAIAERLLKEGCRVTAHYNQSRAEAEALKKLGSDRVHLVQADLTDLAKLPALVASAEKQFGPIDLLVNSASRFFPTPVDQVTDAEWENLERINVRAPFFLAQAAARHMKAGSCIVNIGDVNGERARVNHTSYVASKAALLMVTRNLAKEWGPRIRVNSVSPGAVLLPDSYTEEQKHRAVAKTLLGRVGTPEDIAAAVLFLAGATYVTGFDLKVDGGRSIV